jgi:hypothetical protein
MRVSAKLKHSTQIVIFRKVQTVELELSTGCVVLIFVKRELSFLFSS